MKLSTRSTYGMRALVELSLASGYGPVSATAIAKRQGLSVAYLEQLLHRLKKRGLVTSVRGPRGGYVLAKQPDRITMADVVSILDGGNRGWDGKGWEALRLSLPNGRSNKGKAGRAKGPGPRDDHRHAQRIAHAVWRCVHERLTQSLGTVTLQDLCDEVRSIAGEPLDHRYVFHI